MLVRKIIDIRAPLTSEQIKRLDALDDLKDEDIVFDEECPPQTPEQLKKFRRVNPQRKEKAVG